MPYHQRLYCFVSPIPLISGSPATRTRKVSIRRAPTRACTPEPNRKGADLLAADVQRLKSALKTFRSREPAQLRSELAKQLLERLARTEGALQRAVQSVDVARERITRSIELALLGTDVPGSAASRIRRILGADRSNKLRTLSFFTWQRVPRDIPSHQANRIQRDQRKRMIQAVKDAAEAPLWQNIAKFGARAVVIATDVATSGAKRHSAAVNAFKRSQGGVALAATVSPNALSESEQKSVTSRNREPKKYSLNQRSMKLKDKRSRITKKKTVSSKHNTIESTNRRKTLDLGSNQLQPRSRKKKSESLKQETSAVEKIKSKPWDLNTYRTLLAFAVAEIAGGKATSGSSSDQLRSKIGKKKPEPVGLKTNDLGKSKFKPWGLSSYRTRLAFIVDEIVGDKTTSDLSSHQVESRSGKKRSATRKQKTSDAAASKLQPWDLNSYRTRLAFVAGIIGDKATKQTENASAGVQKSWDLSSYGTRLVFVVAGVFGAKVLLSAAPLIALVSHAAVVGDVRDPIRWKVQVLNTYATRRSNTVRIVDEWLKLRQPRPPLALPALPQARVAPLTKKDNESLEIKHNSFLEAESFQVGMKAPAVLDQPVVGDVLRGVDEVAYFVETRLQRAVRRWYAAAGEYQGTSWSVLRVFEWQRERERECERKRKHKS